MARQSECEHDIGVYRVIGGEGLDVTEACSVCDTRITSESPKTQFKREQEEKKEKKQAAKERKEEREEAREEKKETKKDEKVYTKKEEKDSVKFTEKESKPKKKEFKWY